MKSQDYLEQYEYKGYLISIFPDYRTGNPAGMAQKLQRAHLYDYSHLVYSVVDDILELNDDEMETEYFFVDPIDSTYFLQQIKTPKDVLDYLIFEILESESVDFNHVSKYPCNPHSIIVLKQIQKKGNSPIYFSKRQRGWRHTAWSLMVRERDKKCVKCGSVYDLHAHHIKPYSKYPELRYNVNNGETLCGLCHRNAHKKTKTND